MVKIDKILFPSELREYSLKILPYVLSMSEKYNSTIYLLERPINWVAVKEIIIVAKTDQTKIGILNQVIPGALIRTMVVIRFKPPRIDERPIRYTPRKNIEKPIFARFSLSGG